MSIINTQPVTTGGIPQIGQPQAPGGQPASSPAAQTPTSFDPNPMHGVDGGGMLNDFSETARSLGTTIVGSARNAFSDLSRNISGKMEELRSELVHLSNANEGEVSPAKLQSINTQLAHYTLMFEQIAKMNEQEERAKRVWVMR